MPANEVFYNLDINDSRFMDSLEENLTQKCNRVAYNYLIIAFSNDIQNLDLAEKLSFKLKEWDIFDKTKIFVKIRSSKLQKQAFDTNLFKHNGIIPFAGEETEIYNIKRIVNESSEHMAKLRHVVYSIQSNKDDLDRVKIDARNVWYKKYDVGMQGFCH